MKVKRQDFKQKDVITLEHGGLQKQFISARRIGSDELSIFDDSIAGSETMAAQMVFGGCKFYDDAHSRTPEGDWPTLWLEGDVCPGDQISSMQEFVVLDQPLRRITIGNRVVGTSWSDADADYCLLAGVLPADLTASGGEQTTSCFEQIEAALQMADMDFSHVARTWLYLDDLLAWYDEFNIARTDFFESHGVFDRLVPASTGIGARNPAGAAIAAGALAIRPRHSGVTIKEVKSPLQCSATEYRSSFSRAVEITLPTRRFLTISGTASIAPAGESLFQGDVVRQIHLTLDVVEAILKSRGMDWPNTVRAVGYFRNIADLPTFNVCCLERGIMPLPLAPAHATVCREDLLFEMELDAVSTDSFEESPENNLPKGAAITE
jgi:enamine deaminase RidA (YjgF/YER057c/UK114 family)